MSSLATSPRTAGAAATMEERAGPTGDIVVGVRSKWRLSKWVGRRLIYMKKLGQVTSFVT